MFWLKQEQLYCIITKQVSINSYISTIRIVDSAWLNDKYLFDVLLSYKYSCPIIVETAKRGM